MRREQGTEIGVGRRVHVVELGTKRKALVDLPTDVTEAELLALSANIGSMIVVMLHDD